MSTSKQIVVQQPLVFTSDGTVFANSQQIASHFEKRHDHVLRDIDGLLSHGETPREYFHLSTYIESQNGQEYRCYNMTRDGFTLLCMGFTGEKALKFKVDIIHAFNAMEKSLRGQKVSKIAPARMSGVLMKELRKTMMWMSEEFGLSPASKQALARDLYAPVGIMIEAPKVERTWSTTQLAQVLGVSANMLGRRAGHLKTAENGEMRLTTTTHGKQVQCWAWYQRGCEAVADIFGHDRQLLIEMDDSTPH